MLTCIEPDLSEDGQTEYDSLRVPVDGPKEEQSEIPLAIKLDDMTRKYRDGEQIPPERAQFSEGDGKVVSAKRAFPALKSPSACKGLEGPKELHLEMQQTVDEGKVMPKRECSALKSSPAGTRLDKAGELHPVLQQTAVADQGGSL